MILMSTREHEKRIIQKREQKAPYAFSTLLLIAFLITASIFIAIPHLPGPFAALIVCSAPLFMSGPILLAFILGITIIGPFMQETKHQKQNWLNEYGLHILAPVTKHPEKNAIVISGPGKNYRSSNYIYLNWQDPQTGQLYSFFVNKRYSFALDKLSKGDLCPVQFDPDDPAFFVVPLQ